MRKYLILFILLLPLISIGAITPYTQGWEGTVTLNNWQVSGGGIFNLNSDAPCGGANSVRAKLTGNGELGTAILTSPNLGTNDGGEITFSYSYKWLIDNGNIIGNPIAATAASLDMKWQWANSVGGPWYTFDTKDVNTHNASTNCATVTKTFYAYGAKPLYVRVIVSNLTANGNNYIYIDDVNVQEDTTVVPTCGLPTNLRVTQKTSTSFVKIKWGAPTTGTASSYEWEVRRGGEPGSGPIGREANGVGGLSADNVNVSAPGTTYKIYVRAVCGTNDFGPWIGIDGFTNCDWPSFSPNPNYNLCGIQDVELVGPGPGTKFWFDDEGNFLGTANSYQLTNVDESLKFNVFSGYTNATSNTSVTVGTGIGANTVSVPFTAAKGTKVQFIYQAQELKAAGFEGGIIRSFGLRVGIGGTLTRSNFAIYMGETAHEEFTSTDFIPTDDLKLVKNPGDQLLVANDVNMFDLDDPFIWDGVSNIIVQFTYRESVATSLTATGFASQNYNTSYRALHTSSETLDLNGLNGVSNGTRSEIRVNGYFDVIEGCFGPMKTINVNYTEAPDLILSTNKINNCVGGSLDKLFILTGVGNYDTYEWFPEDVNNPNDPNNASNAISGSATTGWSFNPTTNMTYTLRASNSTGQRCVLTQDVTVEFNPAPELLQMQSNYELCTNDVQELKVVNFVDEEPIKYLFNGNTNGVTLSNTVGADVISSDTSLYSEGTASLKMAYGAQSNAILNFNAAINVTNLQSVIVEFDHIAALQATSSSVMDYAYLEYSTNNGATWEAFLPSDYTGGANTSLTKPTSNTSLQAMFFTSTSYPDWNGIAQASVPAVTPWKSEKFTVPASVFTGANGTFKLRFRVGADGNTQFPGWYIDNVKITPVSKYQITWSPIANLYYDQNATVPYDGTKNAGTLYLKGTSNSLNVPYKVEVETQYGCKAEKNFTVSIGLNESPVVHNIDSCGPIDVANTNFGKNPNGVLTYYSSAGANTPITQISSSGVYYVQQEISTCKSARVPFTVVINPKASVPVAPANQSFCGAATVNDLVFNAIQGFQIKWYLTPTGGTNLPTGVPINNGTYYGEFTNGACTSDSRVAVNVAVSVVPASITMNDVYICGTSTISDVKVNSAPNAIVNWYQNITDTTPLANTTVLTTGTYYISQKLNNCESAKTAVNVTTIQNLPLPSATTLQTFCGSGTVGDLMATTTSAGATINWYSFSTSDTPLVASTPLTSGTYYVGQSVGDCDSPKRPVSVRILSTSAPLIYPIDICGDATVSSLPLNPTATISYKVYDSMWAITELGQNTVITTGVYYISIVEDGCESLRTSVQITVNPRPNVPTGNANQSFFDYAQVKDLKTNESNVIWFDSYNDAVNNVNPLPSTHVLIDGRTYYGVIVGTGNCASLPIEVKVTITLGLNDLDLAALKYYPNPAESQLTVSYKDVIKSLEVFDLSGKLIKTQAFESNDVRLDVSTLSAGTYMIKVHTNVGSQFIKIVKK